MRYIPADRLRVPEALLARILEAKSEIEALAGQLNEAHEEAIPEILKQLRNAINARSELWTELKDRLATLSWQKCWYCESRENRSDMAVDHFRPKNRVYECKSHKGYWWLAFNTSNYRFACGLCNSPHVNEEEDATLGKGTHFPLIDEATRVYESVGVLAGESVCLLDPTVAMDPGLLAFSEDGRALPSYSPESSPLFHKRAETSIAIYNLNDVKVREERTVIALEVQRQVQRADKYLTEASKGDEPALEHFKEASRLLMGMMGPQAEFSSAARAVLSGYRDKEWVAAVLRTV